MDGDMTPYGMLLFFTIGKAVSSITRPCRKDPVGKTLKERAGRKLR